jgi:hypothetical protein
VVQTGTGGLNRHWWLKPALVANRHWWLSTGTGGSNRHWWLKPALVAQQTGTGGAAKPALVAQ